MPAATTEYTLALHWPHVEDLDSGQVLERGQSVRLKEEEAKKPKAASLIESGALIEVPKAKKEGK